MIYEEIFKPQDFEDYIGQESAKELIQIMLDAADAEERYYPNILLTGPPGLGKTSLAKIIFGIIPHKFTDGTAVNSIHEELRGFVIIDEIHRVKPEVCDALNLKIDDNKIIIVGCTTNPGMLPAPFRSRFQIVPLIPYQLEELVSIMRNVLNRKGTLQISDDYLMTVAQRSRQTPRTALKYLSFIMDLMVVRKVTELNDEILEEALEMLKVDENGLLPIDHDYLEALPVDKPVGIQYLQAVLSYDKETIEQEIEPYLLQLKMIDRTPRGRVRLFEESLSKKVEELLFPQEKFLPTT